MAKLKYIDCFVLFECFKWDAFKTIFYLSNETMLGLFNFMVLCILFQATKMYLNHCKQNKNDSINNKNDDDS